MTTATAESGRGSPGPEPEQDRRTRVFALVGNPNSGKTTLFNALTGLRQKVGNYPGITVERKEGSLYSQHGEPIHLIDLPGAYSLSARSLDEAIMQEVLLGRREDTARLDGVICVLDASNIERNLYLASQVLELDLPVILVLNMIDVAHANGLRIDAEKLADRLHTTVVRTNAVRGEGINELRIALSRKDLPVCPHTHVTGEPLYEEAVAVLSECLRDPGGGSDRKARAEAYLHLTESASAGEHTGAATAPANARDLAGHWCKRLDQECPGWRECLVANRYSGIGEICAETVERKDPGKPSLTDRVDRLLLHPVLGWGALIGVLGALFWSIFRIAETPMDWVDWLFGKLGAAAAAALPEGPLRELAVGGIIDGVGAVVIFLPQILMLFFFIGILESTGYMARAAFILDRLMGRVGLSGRSFVPLLSSYACAIPGIMATRTIASTRERFATIMVAPFMSCTARLPVYFVMIPVLAGANASAWTQAGLLLGAYFLGTAGAFGTAFCFRRTLLRGTGDGQVMELPPYRVPSLRNILMDTLDRGWIFLRKAGTIILGLSILIWAAMTYPQAPEPAAGEPALTPAEELEYSAAGRLGHAIEPVIEPLGYDWKIGIGVLASFAAREVFVSTMAIAYNLDEEGAMEETEAGNVPIVEEMRRQTRADGSPLFTPLTCLSILVFFIFALQCMATVAVVKRETNSWRWPLFQLGYMTAFAYLAALLVYQGGRLLGFA